MTILHVSRVFEIRNRGTVAFFDERSPAGWAWAEHLVRITSLGGEARTARAHVEFARTHDGEAMTLVFPDLAPADLEIGSRIEPLSVERARDRTRDG